MMAAVQNAACNVWTPGGLSSHIFLSNKKSYFIIGKHLVVCVKQKKAKENEFPILKISTEIYFLAMVKF